MSNAKRPPPARTAVRNKTGKERTIDYDILPDLIGFHLRRAQVSVFGHFTRATRSLQMTPGLSGVLMVVGRNPGLTQTQLARALDIENPTLVEVLDKLAARGWVERRPLPEDRRSRTVHLTPKGQSRLRDLRLRVLAHEAEVFSGFSEKEKVLLKTLLARLSDFRLTRA
jgi:DNA-binding MarR family transcriptional regulator